MKTLGLIGGISWVSTVDYYRYINSGINACLGGLNFASCIIYSFNYADIIAKNNSGDTEGTYQLLYDACIGLRQSGAEGIILCANTMHMYADRLEGDIQLPLVHIADATAKEINKQSINKVALLGTKFTMEKDFFKGRLNGKGIEVIIPNDEDREFIHYTIFEELGRGLAFPSSKERYISIINELVMQGAQGVILGCTEIPLLITQSDVVVPVFDTTRIHADAAVEFMLSSLK